MDNIINILFSDAGGTQNWRYNLAGDLLVQTVLSNTPDVTNMVFNTPSVKQAPFIIQNGLPVQPGTPPGSFGLDIAKNISLPLASGFLSDAGNNIWWNQNSPNILWGQHRYGTESGGNPVVRLASTLVQWTNNSGVWSIANNIYPAGILNGILYDYSFLYGNAATKDLFTFSQANNPDNGTQNTLAVFVYDYDTGALLRSGVIDQTQANGVFVGGGPIQVCGNMLGGYFAYFHHSLQPLPIDYPNVHWLNRLNLQNFSVISSQTPTQAGAPAPWDGSGLNPLLTQAFGVGAISATGRYVFMCDNRTLGVNKFPYLFWDVETNTIVYYATMTTVAGFTIGNYLANAPMRVVWDKNDKLWMLLERTNTTFDLIRFTIVGNDIAQDFITNLNINPVIFGNLPSIVLSLVSGVPAPLSIVHLPPPFYVMGPRGQELLK